MRVLFFAQVFFFENHFLSPFSVLDSSLLYGSTLSGSLNENDL